MPAVWVNYLFRLGLLIFAGLFIGWLYDGPLIGFMLALLIALAWQLVWLYRMDQWIHGSKMAHLPEGSGIWAQVFARVDFLRVRSKRRSKKFKMLVKEMQRATRSFPDGGIILGNDNEIMAMNRAAERLLGLKRKEDRGLRVENLIRDPDFVTYLVGQDYSAAIEFASPVRNDCWLSAQIAPYGLDQRLLLLRDITQQRKADQMRRDFVANASHELRTPLTVITGYLDALIDDPALDESLRNPLQEMERQSIRMRTLVNDLLHLSELESQGVAELGEPVNISAILNTARQEARAMQGCPEKIDIKLISDKELCGDANDIQSVVSNLVSNAVRYTPTDGCITISWDTDDAGGHLSVRDTGMGIGEEHLPRLTERFYRAENGRERLSADGGIGLGLAIVKHALYRHSATLKVESEPGQGSLFICNFPQERITSAA